MGAVFGQNSNTALRRESGETPGLQMKGSGAFTVHYHFSSRANQNAELYNVSTRKCFIFYSEYTDECVLLCVKEGGVAPCCVRSCTSVTVSEGGDNMWLGVCVCIKECVFATQTETHFYCITPYTHTTE